MVNIPPTYQRMNPRPEPNKGKEMAKGCLSIGCAAILIVIAVISFLVFAALVGTMNNM